MASAIARSANSTAPPDHAAILRLEQVTRRFGGVVATDNVTLDVRANELLGIIGPNGAGKTTLFNLITGFARPNAGRILFHGRRIDRLGPHRIAHLGIARTFQNIRVFPNLSVFDNVSAGAIGRLGFAPWRAVLPSRRDARADEITIRTWQALDRVGLADTADWLAVDLSYGRRKYLEIARALATGPELLILDEPAAGLNEAETETLGRFIRDLSRTGLTILLVEHDMGLVMSVCERVAVLAAGRKIADAAPDVVRADAAVRTAYLGDDEP